MFTQEQAITVREKIHKEVPHLDIQIKPEEPPYVCYYYLEIFKEGKLRFIVRDEIQWQERKHLIIA